MSISKMEMFKNLSNMELAKALGKMERIRLPAGSLLFRQGDEGHRMYLVQSGEVRLSAESPDGSSQPLAVLGEAEAFGEMALLTGEARSATAIALTDAELFALDKETFDELILEQPAISAYFISLLSRRLVRTNDRLQVSSEENEKRVLLDLERLPAVRRNMLIDCAALPFFDGGLLRSLFDPDEADRLLEQLRQGDETLRVEPAGDGRGFAIPGTVLGVLLRLFEETRAPSMKAALQDRAADYWVKEGDRASAIRLYAAVDRWQEAVALAAGSTDSPDRADLDLLDRCPAALLFGEFELLCDYLAYCAANGRKEGMGKAEAAIREWPSPFSAKQKATLYERGADLADKLGMSAKSAEFMALAEALTATSPNSDILPGEAEERAYRAGKLKMERQRTGESASRAGRLLKSRTLSLVIALAVAAVSMIYFHFASPLGELSRQGMIFIGIGIAAVALWIANAVPDYLVALFMAMLWVLEGLVTPETALSGFASTAWLYMLFILAFGAVIMKSGILFRLSLHALKRFPATYRGQLWGVVAGGTLLNPLIPSSSAKVALGVPIARTLSEAMGFRERGKESAGLGLAAMVFYGFTAPFVLTGSYSNVLAFGLADGEKQPGWFHWFAYALPAFLLFSVVMLAVLFMTFRPSGGAAKPVSRQVLDDQLKLLGKPTRQETTTAITAIGTVALLIAQPLHGLDNAWVMLLGFAVLVMTGTMDGQTLRGGVDWTFLLFIGIAFSFAEGAKQLGIAEAMSDFLGKHMGAFLSSPTLFLAAAMLASFAATFVVRDDPALILLVIAMLPLAEQAGVDPWVLVFVVLLCTDPFFFAYQSPTYLTAYYSAEGKAFSHRQGRKIALGYALAVTVAVLASIPYWQWLGLIG